MRTIDIADLPVVTTEQMREVDRIMVSEFGISLIQMMENAGQSLAQLTLELYAPKSVIVLAGPGGNGGGGLAAARHLANHGIELDIVLAFPEERADEAAQVQLQALRRMGIRFRTTPESGHLPDVVIDALIGYGLSGPPVGVAAELIAWTNEVPAQVLALDVPSGFDAQSGRALDPCVRADATLTIAAPKRGLVGEVKAGRIYLADISVPNDIYRRWGYRGGNIFEQEWVVRVVDRAKQTNTHRQWS